MKNSIAKKIGFTGNEGSGRQILKVVRNIRELGYELFLGILGSESGFYSDKEEAHLGIIMRTKCNVSTNIFNCIKAFVKEYDNSVINWGYSLSTEVIRLSFDHGTVQARTYEEAKVLAIADLKKKLAAANSGIELIKGMEGESIDMNFDNIELEEGNRWWADLHVRAVALMERLEEKYSLKSTVSLDEFRDRISSFATSTELAEIDDLLNKF